MKLYITFGQFFFDNFGLMYSFGLILFVDLGMIILHCWKPVLCLGKSICERLSGDKVILHVLKNEEIIDLDTFPGPQRPLWDPRSRANAQWILHMARRIGFREQYYTGTKVYLCQGRLQAI